MEKERTEYFIKVEYTQSNLSSMERNLLEKARQFDKCLIADYQIEPLMDYFKSLKEDSHKAKTKLKTIEITKFIATDGFIFIHIGKISLVLQEIREDTSGIYRLFTR